jgi:hypothetical protein
VSVLVGSARVTSFPSTIVLRHPSFGLVLATTLESAARLYFASKVMRAKRRPTTSRHVDIGSQPLRERQGSSGSSTSGHLQPVLIRGHWSVADSSSRAFNTSPPSSPCSWGTNFGNMAWQVPTPAQCVAGSNPPSHGFGLRSGNCDRRRIIVLSVETHAGRRCSRISVGPI